MKTFRWTVAAVLTLAMALAPSGPVSAISGPWPWADNHTDVSPANRTFQYRTPSAATGQQGAHELSARRNRNDDSRGRAAAAVKRKFEAVFADRLRVHFFGRAAEAAVDPSAKLKAYVHCVGELDSEWVLVGGKDVQPSTTSDTLDRAITVEDCETQTEDGVMLQVVTGERGDRKRRTVFLQRAELGPLGAAVWTEDFTTP